MADRLARIRERIATTGLSSNYDDRMDFRVVAGETRRGHAVVEADVGERDWNPMEVVHGGVVTGLADTAMGVCMTGLLAPGEGCTNIELHVRFLRATTAGRLRATALPLREGRRITVVEARVTDEEGRLVARADSAFLRVPMDAA
jgi:uncharacterized protein (TIGR00369 family)